MDKRTLLKSTLPEAEVEIPGKGTVRVRALSRAEVVDELNEVDRSIPGAFETRLLAMSLVDPALTEGDVRKWRKATDPSEVGLVIDKLNELSALTSDVDKETYKEFEENPDESFRSLPGGEAVDDGGAPEG